MSPDWMAQAKCRGTDPELFFPVRGSNADYRQAVTVCAECPVRSECLEYAMEQGSNLEGVWGGASERERRRIRAARRRTQARRCRACGLVKPAFAYDGSSPDCALCVSRRNEATRRTG